MHGSPCTWHGGCTLGTLKGLLLMMIERNAGEMKISEGEKERQIWQGLSREKGEVE